MATPTFCSLCDRAVYVADGDDFSCPVCSSALPDTTATVEAEAAGTFSEYHRG